MRTVCDYVTLPERQCARWLCNLGSVPHADVSVDREYWQLIKQWQIQDFSFHPKGSLFLLRFLNSILFFFLREENEEMHVRKVL